MILDNHGDDIYLLQFKMQRFIVQFDLIMQFVFIIDFVRMWHIMRQMSTVAIDFARHDQMSCW